MLTTDGKHLTYVNNSPLLTSDCINNWPSLTSRSITDRQKLISDCDLKMRGLKKFNQFPEKVKSVFKYFPDSSTSRSDFSGSLTCRRILVSSKCFSDIWTNIPMKYMNNIRVIIFSKLILKQRFIFSTIKMKRKYVCLNSSARSALRRFHNICSENYVWYQFCYNLLPKIVQKSHQNYSSRIFKDRSN